MNVAREYSLKMNIDYISAAYDSSMKEEFIRRNLLF
mgnify:CR=1 FL=1